MGFLFIYSASHSVGPFTLGTQVFSSRKFPWIVSLISFLFHYFSLSRFFFLKGQEYLKFLNWFSAFLYVLCYFFIFKSILLIYRHFFFQLYCYHSYYFLWVLSFTGSRKLSVGSRFLAGQKLRLILFLVCEIYLTSDLQYS